MSPELIAILVTALLQCIGLIALGVMIYRLGKLLDVTGRVIMLQDRRIEEIVKDTNELIRQELLKVRAT